MANSLIDGAAAARRVREEVALRVADLLEQTGRRPGLATVLVDGDLASSVYVGNKRRACAAAGMSDHHRHLAAGTAQKDVAAVLDELAIDDDVAGILLQLPLPTHLQADTLIQRIPPSKDVDGLTITNVGRLAVGAPGLRPCTPMGVLRLLDDYHVRLNAANAVVVGRSSLVGRPVAQMLLARNATVTVCHSRTADLASVCRQADVLVVAAGVPALIGPDAVRPGATVIDVGIHRGPKGLYGDVQFDRVVDRAGLITPVPGGVGPMTIAMLLANTLTAFEAQLAKPRPMTSQEGAGGSIRHRR